VTRGGEEEIIEMKSAQEREALAAEFDRHVVEEDEILKQYHTLSDKLAEGPLSVLVNHIVTDEEMHHFLLRTMADWLRGAPTPGKSVSEQGLDREAILRHTRTLQEHEKKTIESCRELKTRLSGEERELFATILDTIALDSEKHHRLLAAVEKMIGS
jgi:hypothetical protein